MIVEIKNLGFVKNVKVNLGKDLIILCGPNNTGKTYVAYALYGFLKHRSVQSQINRINTAVQKLPETGEIELDLIKILETKGSQHLNSVAKDYQKNIPRIFASGDGTFKKTEIETELGDLDVLKSKILETNIAVSVGFVNGISAKITKEIGTAILKCFLFKDKKETNDKKEATVSVFMDFLSNRIHEIYLSFFFSKPYIATAERIAINLFSKELSIKRNTLVDKLLELKDEGKDEDPFDLIRRRANRYPLPIRDSLEIAEDLNNFKKNTSSFNDFADEIETTILKGKVIISKEGEVQFKPETNKRVTLPIHLSSSVVKSLSNLVIYFRHLATPNDFIILDEPEMNLHPDNQVIVARIIAKIVNKGFKVLVNTHSDYIIRELNNLIMLSNKRDYLEEFGYAENEILQPDRIEALLFRYDKRGKVESLKVTETGFEVKTIDEVINELNARSQSLYFGTLS